MGCKWVLSRKMNIITILPGSLQLIVMLLQYMYKLVIVLMITNTPPLEQDRQKYISVILSFLYIHYVNVYSGNPCSAALDQKPICRLPEDQVMPKSSEIRSKNYLPSPQIRQASREQFA